jgi:hypothetical protein
LLIPVLVALDYGRRSRSDLAFAALVWLGWVLLGIGLTQDETLFRATVLALHVLALAWIVVRLRRRQPDQVACGQPVQRL